MNFQTVSFSDDDFISPPELIATTAYLFGGEIELDPASSEQANQVVQAKKYFSWHKNGLNQEWRAKNVYLFPPRSILNGDEQPKDTRLFQKNYRFKKSAQRVWLELAYHKWLRNEFEQAVIFLTSTEVALLVTQRIGFDFPLCVLKDKPYLLKEKDLKPIDTKVFGFVYYLPPREDYQLGVRKFCDLYSTLGRVYT
jgi:hypothetical protein